MKRLIPLSLVAVALLSAAFWPEDRSIRLDNPFRRALTAAPPAADTLPPLRPRFGDFLRDRNANPFDLKDPKEVKQDVEFDPITGQYILTERIGEEYYRPSTTMSFEEYLDYRR
ncbi:MAG TPA: hypothetical protein PLI34_16960, partial [Saprospiraceae bacterium]|nr:hypothetical protein [Saprospiraceae bacterium]